MGIPSVDTYLRNTIDKNLKAILSDPEITGSILKDFDVQTSQSFINYYAVPEHEVPVTFAFPNNKSQFQGCIQISLLHGEETQDSIGSAIGEYSFDEDDARIELSDVQIDNSGNVAKMFLEMSQNVGYVESVEQMTFGEGEPVIQKKRIYFDYNDDAVGQSFIVHYVPVDTLDQSVNTSGLSVGYLATESYGIRSLSMNMDTVRCLDTLVKTLLIMSRRSLEEQYSLSLQHMSYDEIEPVNPYGDDSGQLLFGRQITLNYQVPYSLDINDDPALQGISIKGRVKRG